MHHIQEINTRAIVTCLLCKDDHGDEYFGLDLQLDCILFFIFVFLAKYSLDTRYDANYRARKSHKIECN